MIETNLEYDPSADQIVTFNDTGVSDSEVYKALGAQHPELKSLAEWANRSQADGIFQRDRYSNPQGVFGEIRAAQDAVENDDTTSGVADTTEQIAFNRVEIECSNPQQQDVWNQILDDLQIEKRFREIWREQFTTSNTYVAVLFGKKSYKVTLPTETGQKPKKEFKNLTVPTAINIMDPLRVLPVGNFLFNQEDLAYIATRGEAQKFADILGESGEKTVDQVVSQLLECRYDADRAEQAEIRNEIGESVVLTNLYKMRKDRVFKITATRSQYQRFAAVRMKSIFELLDLKAKLRQMDRAHLQGGTNFIILVTKGSDDHPARPEEMEPLAAQVRTASRVPIIVSDHRLNIEIITPKLDKTLNPERYNALDARITARLYQIFSAGNYASGTANDDSIKLLRVVARSMEARRNIIRDEFYRNVIRQTWEANDELTEKPRIVFYPRRISLDFDANVVTALLELRAGGDISRDSILAEMDIIQSEEAQKREYEAKNFDKFFPVPVQPGAPAPDNSGTIPTNGEPPTKAPATKAPAKKAPAKAPVAKKAPGATKKQAGRAGGGNRNGGGQNPASMKSQPGRGPAKPK